MKSDGKILIVDDEEGIAFSLKLLLKRHYKVVTTENNPFHIPRLISQRNPDIVILDMNFSRGRTDGSEGLHWLMKIKEIDPSIQVLMVTAYSDVSTAVETLKSGATDFIEKPWRNEKLVATVKSAFELRSTLSKVKSLTDQNQLLNKTLDEPFSEMIGTSPQMHDIYKTIDKVSMTDAHVLIMGENGTGKELIARAIHRKSRRQDQVFIPVDLGAIAETLFESELFGHKRGAFTDAYEDRIGRFEVANKGTIFLDEIGNVSLPLQSKLLHVLQHNKARPVGSSKEIDLDTRIICATNMPLYDMVEENTFRQDLLYRINTVEINVPPLRERKGDIPLLVDHFMAQLKQKYNKPNIALHPQTLSKLEAYFWPGNIRELRHLMERAVILADGDIITPHEVIAPQSRHKNKTFSLNLEELERKSVHKALEIHQGNITKAAKDLGITRAALYRRIEKFDIN